LILAIDLALNMVTKLLNRFELINPKSSTASLDLKRGVGFIETVFFFEFGRDIYI
jgi:hypothetical protein